MHKQRHSLHSWQHIELLHKLYMASAPLHKTQPTLLNKPKINYMSHYIIFQKQIVQNKKTTNNDEKASQISHCQRSSLRGKHLQQTMTASMHLSDSAKVQAQLSLLLFLSQDQLFSLRTHHLG